MVDFSSSPGIVKFIGIALFAFVILGLLVNLGTALLIWKNTGDWKPTVESTFGQVIFWDNQIYENAVTLKNTEFMNTVPPSLQKDFKDFLTQQILFYIVMFAVTGYALFKLGNWLAGSAAFEASTDVIIIATILLIIFPLAEFSYGYIMHGETVVPYRGVAQLFDGKVWTAMLGTELIPQSEIYGNYAPVNQTNQTVAGTIINVGGG